MIPIANEKDYSVTAISKWYQHAVLIDTKYSISFKTHNYICENIFFSTHNYICENILSQLETIYDSMTSEYI